MIPRLVDLIDGYNFWAIAHGYTSGPTAGALRDALEEATRLSGGDATSEAAALFYALVRRPEEMGDGWRDFPPLVARNLAASEGYRITATAEELHRLRIDICLDRLPFEAVRDYFAERMTSAAGPTRP